MGLSVCPGCGVIAPTERSQCALCQTPFQTPRLELPERSDDRFWVRLRCRFRCRSCGRWTPLGYLDIEGVVRCAACGLEQAYDVNVWRHGLETAHAVGDLRGPNPEGRRPSSVSIAGRNPYSKIGRSDNCFDSEQSGLLTVSGVVETQSLHLEAAPGHPLCDKCRTPLQAQVDAAGRLVTACVRCNSRTSYELPASTRALHNGFDGATATEYRTDRRDVRVRSTSQGAVVALECPNCSAALEMDGKSPIVTCQYCHTECCIPSHTLAVIGREAAVAHPWWVLLRGPSATRANLERQAEKAAREQRIEAEERARRQQIEAERKIEAEAARRFQQPKEKKGGTWLDRTFGVVVPLLVVGAVGAVGFWSRLVPWPFGGRAAQVVAPDKRSGFQAVQGCWCRANTDGKPGRELVQLAMHPTGQTSSGWELEYSLDVGGTPYLLANEASDVAPPHELNGSHLNVGMACTDHVVVIAAAGHVTGWSTENGARLWTTPVDGWSASAGTYGALKLECVSLHTHGGIVTVPGGSGAAHIRIATGKSL